MRFTALVVLSALTALVAASPIVNEVRQPEPGYRRADGVALGFKINKRDAEAEIGSREAEPGYRRADGVALRFKINKRDAEAEVESREAEPGYRRAEGVALGFKIN